MVNFPTVEDSRASDTYYDCNALFALTAGFSDMGGHIVPARRAGLRTM